MTTLIFVRHGQSESNLSHIFTGQMPTSLTPLGRVQADHTAEYLRDFPITAIYASDLERAMDTAAPTAKIHGLSVTPDAALREINAGAWEGNTYEHLKATYGASYALWIEDIGRAAPEGGERVTELYERVNAEVDRLIEKHRGECIAIFTHATPARSIMCKLLGYPPEQMARVPWATNASVSIAEFADDGTSRVLQYSYDAHQGNSATHFPKGTV